MEIFYIIQKTNTSYIDVMPDTNIKQKQMPAPQESVLILFDKKSRDPCINNIQNK